MTTLSGPEARVPLMLSIADAIPADIYADEDGKPYTGPTWPQLDGTAIILCPDCGEIAETDEFFACGTVYSTWGDPNTCTEDDRCNVCKCEGYVLVGI